MINFGANITLSILGNLFLTPLLNDPISTLLDGARFLSGKSLFLFYLSWILSFGVPSVLSFYHEFPILKAFWTGEFSELAKRRLLNTSVVQALIGVTGYTIGFFISVLQLHLMAEDLLNFTNLFSQLLSSMIAFLFSFGFIYYTLEYIIQKYFLHYAFPDNVLSRVDGVIQISIRMRFMIFYQSVSIFPLFIFYKILLGNMTPAIESNKNSLFSLFLFLIVTGFLISLFISVSYQNPLKKMSEATERIRFTDYEVEIPVRSVDELGTLSENIILMAQSLKEKEFIKDTFGRIVDPSVRDYFLKGNRSLGGELEEVSILFCDIRSFTTLSENLPPQKIVELLNRYFTRLQISVNRNHGMINKYIGDAILAVFNAPVKIDNHSDHALNTAIEIRRELKSLNLELKNEGFPEIQNGIGLHRGQVVAGAIGSSDRMEYTIIGDNVNIASRIEGLCKEFKLPILFSEELYRSLENPIGEPVGKSPIRGRKQAISLYGIREIDGIY
ncbi:MAG: adenylate/guanylate cyclase domain-containing protein [Leptospiraceae bacterium]|nr:adenylate/guanylate cyclase domain-containing protein [Leptospiraceae bacterium]